MNPNMQLVGVKSSRAAEPNSSNRRTPQWRQMRSSSARLLLMIDTMMLVCDFQGLLFHRCRFGARLLGSRSENR